MHVDIWSRYHPSTVLWSLSDEILWPHSVESSSYFRSLISWLSFCAVRFLWFFAYFLMTSVTYGMPKLLCKVTFDIYQGELASFLNVLDWNVWRIFVLEGLLHPHSSIPYVQTSLIIALYMVILFQGIVVIFYFSASTYFWLWALIVFF
jgi:hypothetical protein